MKNILYTPLLAILVFSVNAQKKVILDTDPSFDPDDVGCMAMLHTMATQGECDILAVINSTNQKESALCISAINHFYNRGAIPIGDYKGYAKKINATENTYDYHIAKEYPRPLERWEESLDGVKLYRELLAGAQDTSITVVIIGTMHNFYGLLKSKPDAFSNKTGQELVKQKVKLVVTMGGNFLDNRGVDRTNWGGSELLCDYTSWSCLNEERNRMCRYVIENCPAPFMASGWENGNGDYYNANNGNVMSGQELKQLPKNHVVRKSYEYHFAYRGGDDNIDRHSNDQCALHYAIRGESKNYAAYTNGKITLSEKGVCEWKPTLKGIQGHIQKKRGDSLIAQEIEVLMMGKEPKFDTSPPSMPENLSLTDTNGQKKIHWDVSKDTTPGSWVAGYKIYRNGKFTRRVYGRQYSVDEALEKDVIYEVSAFNASGTESKRNQLKL
ncbi:MAG: hypothetical protein AAGB24_02880 [Bacteroidota bacterium]